MKRGLGKGLDALFEDNSIDSPEGSRPVTVRISEIEPNRSQPRKKFDGEALEQLAASIREHGVLQPLMVRPMAGSEGYQLVAGERRWRAARMAGLSEVPVIVRKLDDREVMEVALVENLQREDLNPIEEAEGYQQLMEVHGLTQEEAAERVGRSRPAVANALRLLNLPAGVREMVRDGRLSQGHARTILSLEDSEDMTRLADEIVKKNLSVRNVEKLVKNLRKAAVAPQQAAKLPGLLAGEVERGLSEVLGRKVRVVEGKNKGILEIEFYGDEDLRQLSTQLAPGEK